MHENSLKAYKTERIKLGRRASEVLGTILELGHCTDRMVKDKLKYSEMNAVRPRITELIKKGLVEEAGSKKDELTGKSVRIIRIKPADGYVPSICNPQSELPELNKTPYTLGIKDELDPIPNKETIFEAMHKAAKEPIPGLVSVPTIKTEAIRSPENKPCLPEIKAECGDMVQDSLFNLPTNQFGY